MLYLLSTSCVLTLAYSTLFLLGDTLLLLSSCRREGVRSALPGLRGLLGVRLPVDVHVAPCFWEFLVYVLRFRIFCTRHFVIYVINNIRTRFILSFYVICAVIYYSLYCIYVWLDPGTYMIARFISFYKPGVTNSISITYCSKSCMCKYNPRQEADPWQYGYFKHTPLTLQSISLPQFFTNACHCYPTTILFKWPEHLVLVTLFRTLHLMAFVWSQMDSLDGGTFGNILGQYIS